MAWIAITSPWLALIFLILWDAIRPPPAADWSRQDKIALASSLFDVLTLLGAALGIGVAFYAYNEAKRQADAAETQIRVAEKTAKQQLRAYVSIKSIDKTFDAARNVVGLDVTVINSGQTPALKFQTAVRVGVRQLPLAESTFFDVSFDNSPKGVLGPQNTIHVPTELPIPLHPADQLRVVAGIYAIVVYGEVRYFDIFGNPHWLKIRSHMSGNDFVTGKVKQSLRGNDSDDDFKSSD